MARSPSSRDTVVADRFSIRDASAFSGLSQAMVNYLVREDLIRPSRGRRRGRGIERRFSFADLVLMRALAKLLAGGVSVLRLQKALTRLGAMQEELSTERPASAYLITDGREVLLRHKTGVLELLSTGQFEFAFVVEMEPLRREAVAYASAMKTQPVRRARKIA